MKTIPVHSRLTRLCSTAFLVVSASIAPAASLLLDFGNPPINNGAETNAATTPGPVASGKYLTLSPGHATGDVALGETAWNTITTSNPRTNLNYSNGTSAVGVTLTLGQESSAGNNIINYSTAISSLALVGSGGATTTQKSLLFAGSIYGDSRVESTAVGRDAFFGGTGAAIGFRVDGLAAGMYDVYLMGRNTNSNNSTTGGMTFHATTGTSSGTFTDFTSAPSAFQANTNYSTAAYTNQHESFAEGLNYVALSVTIAEGESLFVASNGTESETRGFLNMAQIVAIPEPSATLLGALGVLGLLRRRRASLSV